MKLRSNKFIICWIYLKLRRYYNFGRKRTLVIPAQEKKFCETKIPGHCWNSRERKFREIKILLGKRSKRLRETKLPRNWRKDSKLPKIPEEIEILEEKISRSQKSRRETKISKHWEKNSKKWKIFRRKDPKLPKIPEKIETLEEKISRSQKSRQETKISQHRKLKRKEFQEIKKIKDLSRNRNSTKEIERKRKTPRDQNLFC